MKLGSFACHSLSLKSTAKTFVTSFAKREPTRHYSSLLTPLSRSTRPTPRSRPTMWKTTRPSTTATRQRSTACHCPRSQSGSTIHETAGRDPFPACSLSKGVHPAEFPTCRRSGQSVTPTIFSPGFGKPARSAGPKRPPTPRRPTVRNYSPTYVPTPASITEASPTCRTIQRSAACITSSRTYRNPPAKR